MAIVINSVRVSGGSSNLDGTPEGTPGGGGEGGGSPVLSWPGITFSDKYLQHIVPYNNIWYYEYILLSGGSLQFNFPYTVDLFLVGAGGSGSASGAKSNGGGSGYPVFQLGVNFPVGSYAVTIGSTSATTIVLPVGTLSASRGGNASSGAGSGFTGTYNLYGDTNYPAGSGSAATGVEVFGYSDYPPGTGGKGCTMLPFAGTQAYRRNTAGGAQYTPNINPQIASGRGFGAGAYGSGISVKLSEYTIGAYSTSPAQGVLALRLPV